MWNSWWTCKYWRIVDYNEIECCWAAIKPIAKYYGYWCRAWRDRWCYHNVIRIIKCPGWPHRDWRGDGITLVILHRWKRISIWILQVYCDISRRRYKVGSRIRGAWRIIYVDYKRKGLFVHFIFQLHRDSGWYRSVSGWSTCLGRLDKNPSRGRECNEWWQTCT